MRDFQPCYANISTFKDHKNNEFFKEMNNGNHSKFAIA